jgi:hypothetical protein
MAENSIINKQAFRSEVLSRVSEFKTNYIDAVLHVLDRYGLDPEDGDRLLDAAMRTAIEREAVALRMVEGDDNSSLTGLVE